MTTKRAKKTTTAGKTRITVETPENPVEEQQEEEPTDQAILPDDEDIEEAVSGLPQEARIELWKWGEPSVPDEWNYIGRLPVHGFTLDAVSRQHGGGKYRAIIRGPRIGEDGRTRVVQLHRRHFVVGGGAPITPASDTGITVADMLKLNLQMMQTMMSAPKEPMADMIRAIHELSKPQGDPLQTAIQLVQLLKGDKSDQDSVLEILRLGIDLASERTDAGGIGAFAGAFAKLLADAKGQPAPTGAPALPPGQPVQPPQPTEDQQVEAMLQSMVQSLRIAAQRDADIDLYAEWLGDQIEGMPFLHPHVGGWLADESYPDNVLPIFVGVPEAWIRAVLNRFREMVQEQQEDQEGQEGQEDQEDQEDQDENQS